ncbi:LysR family transcriptional regulator [Bradyrhizobium genosp. P]|uniref:LysR family transcriptional regulator n=1 Tax=Bradyrhizobium genosp. P TaxID=83641 RepID=UPI003CEF4FA5
MNWDDLRFVLTVAESGSLASAARDLRWAVSTAMRRLDQIELELNARLFERRRTGYIPTEAGELLLDEARSFAPRIDEIERRLQGRDLSLKGTIRFTTTVTAVPYLLANTLARFSALHPDIVVKLSESSELLEIGGRQADVALRFINEPPEHWVGREIGSVRYRAYSAAGGGRRRKQADISDLFLEQPWIDFSSPENRCSRWVRRNVPSQNVKFQVETFSSMLSLLRAGAGVGLLPTYVGDADAGLVPMSASIDELTNKAWLLTHPELRRTVRVQAFIAVVAKDTSRLLASSSRAALRPAATSRPNLPSDPKMTEATNLN